MALMTKRIVTAVINSTIENPLLADRSGAASHTPVPEVANCGSLFHLQTGACPPKPPQPANGPVPRIGASGVELAAMSYVA
jgi:hypothetical protein